MSTAATHRGRAAERLAEDYLRARGLATLTRNHRCRGGEIDLVMEDRGTVVFVEVRMRGNRGFGGAEDSVDRRKQARIARCAEHYLQTMKDPADRACRFDVVALHGRGGQYDLTWIPHAFVL